ncbi:GNAT family N-acetyltransferase [Achromobacter sp. MYb9]|nr:MULTISPECIES: GNAT family N-acetyltransferase [Achromobacter]PQZ64472.1 GNAT family N-acetyltransferase [Achromobacter sp. MYb9]
MTDFVLKPIDTDDELRACLPLMRELRPHLSGADDFVARITRMRADRYRLLAAVDAGQVVALAGYRYQENLIYGRFMYVDDLVVDSTRRGGRWGARLLQALDGMARDAGCARFVLDTGLSNALAQRFYFRQGLLTSAIRFSKSLDASAA